jgi:hypothetical protein
MLPALIASSLLGFLAPPPPEAPVTVDPISAFLLPSSMDPSLVPEPQGMSASRPRQRWAKGQTVMQGFFGVTEYSDFDVDGGSLGNVDGGGEDAAEMPLLGGGAQTKMGGDKVDFGLEGLISFGWRSNATAFAVGGGGAAIAVDVARS